MISSSDFEMSTEPIEIYRPLVGTYQSESTFVIPDKGRIHLIWMLWDMTTSGYCSPTYVHYSQQGRRR